MFGMQASRALVAHADRLIDVEGVNFGMRYTFNGTPINQKTGIIGQSRINQEMGLEWVDGSGGFDAGVDNLIFGVTTDTKTMGRTTDPYGHPKWSNNFCMLQEYLNVNAIIFTSFNWNSLMLTCCGWLPKHMMLKRGVPFKKGTTRYRDDGTSFDFGTDTREVYNEMLFDVSSMADMLGQIARYADAIGARPQAAPLMGTWWDRFAIFELD